MQQEPVGIPPTELVIVCCHAVFHGRDPLNEDDWALQSFQKSKGQKPGEHVTFLQHIQQAISYRNQSSRPAQIAFSGGRTKHDVPDLSEARSYLHAASTLRWLNDGDVLLEELATDSYQNLLFSVLLFRNLLGYYPSALRIVTHDFKAHRFLNLHRRAIQWPACQFAVIGVPLPPQVPQAELEAIKAAEKRSGYDLWTEDPYGTGELLSSKRKQRRWHDGLQQSMGDSLEENVKQLLSWRGGVDGRELFPHPLPWSRGEV